MVDEADEISDEDLKSSASFYDRLMKHGQQKPKNGKWLGGEEYKPAEHITRITRSPGQEE